MFSPRVPIQVPLGGPVVVDPGLQSYTRLHAGTSTGVWGLYE